MSLEYEYSSHFRSEEMSLCQLLIKKDAAYSCISELGELGLVQFNNLNESENVLHLRFIHQSTRCAEMQRILNYLQDEVEEAGIDIPKVKDEDIPHCPQIKEMLELEAVFEKIEGELLEITRNYQNLRNKYINLLEINEVLKKADEFFLDASSWSDSVTKNLLLDTNDLRGVHLKNREGSPKLGYLTGTIPIENFFTFERVLWRVSRGNFFMRHAEIEEVYLEETIRKFVFMVFFQGDVIERKIRQICQGFRTALYQCPESWTERFNQLESMENMIKDLQIVLEQTNYHRCRILSIAAGDLSLWQIKMKKVTAVFYILNQMSMDEAEKYMIAECWVPTKHIALIQHALYRGALNACSSIPPILVQMKKGNKTPPTFNKTNRITHGFQAIVDAYGVGDYQELNPTPYTIVTFPFLFAVMFGDVGHGMLVGIFAGWMILKEKQLSILKIKNEIWNITFGGRYIILAMGLFSIYTGLLYNDAFSQGLNIFGTSWRAGYNETTILSNQKLQLNPTTMFKSHPYPFGMDPVWGASGENAIVMTNSLKMKIAIILGVLHMFFGMALAAWNHVYFKNYVDLAGFCIPQMIFFSLFLYLDLLIVMKWCWYSATNSAPYNSSCAPSILITFINMVLFKDVGPASEGCEQYMFKSQAGFQRFLLTISLLCIPVMLITKPLYILWKKKQYQLKIKYKLQSQKKDKKVTFSHVAEQNVGDGLPTHIVSLVDSFEDRSNSSLQSIFSDEDGSKDECDNQDIGEIFIHQAIHTIETVLASVSHTASYLRLWALSLAHSQLSHVLWKMVLMKGLQSDSWKGSIGLVFIFPIWCMLTVSILIVMEGLSAFLHTLRLHWVEFQSKFYSGTGVLFQPFNFRKVLEVEDKLE